MGKLTEEMVAARTRVSDCSDVKKLNCWGTELSDVSILRKMKNVEVLSLSVNNINSLADFQNCVHLKDLFVRRNNIKDLNEVCYLQKLSKLKNLWLGENPCAEVDGYRLTVIKALPNLEKLDDKVVTPEEVQNAKLRGKTLVHPLSASPRMLTDSPPRSGRDSPEVMVKYTEDQDLEQRHCSSSDEQRSYEDSPVVDDYQETDKRNANYNTSPVHQYPTSIRYVYEQKGRTKNTDNNSATTKNVENQQDANERSSYTRQNGDYEEPNQRAYTPVSPRLQYPPTDYIDERTMEYEDLQRPPSAQSRRITQNLDREEQSGWMKRTEKDKRKSHFQYQRRPMTRNSNILSAVLCLVKELDLPSLEVVEVAVRSRLDELEE